MNLIERNPARRIPVTRPEKSRIDLSHYVMGSGQIGWLMPIGHYEIVPGDSLSLSSNVRIDYAPLLRPFMTRVDCYIHHHWVPNRLIVPRLNATNSDWEGFIQGDPETKYTNDVIPYATIHNNDIAAGCYDINSLNAYLGLPIIDSAETCSNSGVLTMNVLKQLAYWLIIDEYYRNEWLLERICGPDNSWDINLATRDWTNTAGIQNLMIDEPFMVHKEMDYLWGATTTAYKGSDTDVELDLQVYGPIGMTTNSSGGAGIPAANPVGFPGASETLEDDHGGVPQDLYWRETGAYNMTTLEIMELRRTQALTRFLEAENRLGTDDYEDWLLSIFGVQNPDFRDKNPRYLGGGKIRTNVNSVIATGDVLEPSTDNVVVPAGYRAGLAGVQGSTNNVRLNATEYGVVMSLMSIVPRTSYANRVDRFFLKGATGDRTDFYNPYFQGIGDQEIYSCERGYSLDGADNLATWGYQQRNADMKYYPSYVTGEFAVRGAGGLADFHMAEVHVVSGDPAGLTDAESRVNYALYQNINIFQSTGSEHHLYYTVFNDAQFVRPMYLTDIPV